MRGFLLLNLETIDAGFGVLMGPFLGDGGCQGVPVSDNGVAVRGLYRSPSGALKFQSWTPAYDQRHMSSDLNSTATEASSGKWSGRLTPERIKQLAECLIAGRTRAETAKALGVSPRTVSRWKKDPTVLAEIERLRNRTGETRAADVLLGLLKSDDERIRLAASREIYRWKIQRAPVEPEPEPEPDIEEGYIVVRQEPFR